MLKRGQDSDLGGEDMAISHSPSAPKRPRTSKACTHCRQQKCRCDVDADSRACRRCLHFRIPCSFEGAAADMDGDPSPPARRTSAARPPSDTSKPTQSAGPMHRDSTQSHLRQGQPSSSYSIPDPPLSPPHRLKDESGAFTPLDVIIPVPVPENDIARVAARWSQPLTLVRELAIPGNPNAIVPDDIVARGILSFSEAQELSLIYASLYSGWIPSFAPSSSSFLQTVQYSLAARHLPGAMQAAVLPRLQAAAQKGLCHVMLGAPPGIACAHALQIFTLWSSGYTHAASHSTFDAISFIPGDGELMMSSAMRIAAQIHLELDSQAVLSRKQSPASGTVITTGSDTPLGRSRMLYSLTITDVFLNVGKGRSTVTRAPLSDAERLFGSPGDLMTTAQGAVDARLVLQAQLLDITNEGFRLLAPDDKSKGVGEYLGKAHSFLSQLDEWHQSFLPVVALCNNDFYLTMIAAQYHFCKLALLARYIMVVIRLQRTKSKEGASKSSSSRSSTLEALTLSHSTWMLQSISTAEALLITSLTPPNFHNDLRTHPFTCAPDYVFLCMFFGAIYLARCQFSCLSGEGDAGERAANMPRATTTRGLVIRLQGLFQDVALGPDHLPAQCASVLAALIRVWDERTAVRAAPSRNDAHNRARSSSPFQQSKDIVTENDELIDELDEYESGSSSEATRVRPSTANGEQVNEFHSSNAPPMAFLPNDQDFSSHSIPSTPFAFPPLSQAIHMPPIFNFEAFDTGEFLFDGLFGQILTTPSWSTIGSGRSFK